MELVDFATPAPPSHRGAVVALGTFDAMHVEDQRVIERTCEVAREIGGVAAALLFEPHPRRLLHPEQPPFSLMNTDQRRRALKHHGLQRLYLGMFSPALAGLSAPAFVHEVVEERLGATHVCASTRIQFGSSEADRTTFLAALKSAYGERFFAVEPEGDASRPYVASAGIREALERGDLELASRQLGRRYAIAGPVTHGAKLGRTIGFPTLNIPLGEYLRPALGIYASLTTLPDGRRLQGVSYIGKRPTVHGHEELLETFLFDFDEVIYGQLVETELVELLRLDQTFSGLEEMRRQIVLDCENALRALSNIDLKPASVFAGVGR